jgi:hypothetical protein
VATSVKEKGIRAELLLRDDVLLEAWGKVEQDAWDEIKSSPADAADVREAAYHRVKAIEAVKDKLQEFITELKMQDRKTE